METIDEPKKELNLGNEYLEIQSSYVVRLKEVFTIHTKSGTVYLEVDISADMVKVPEEYREIFMNMMTAKYLNRISVCNTGVFCGKDVKDKPWWKKRLLKWLNQQ